MLGRQFIVMILADPGFGGCGTKLDWTPHWVLSDPRRSASYQLGGGVSARGHYPLRRHQALAVLYPPGLSGIHLVMC